MLPPPRVLQFAEFLNNGSSEGVLKKMQAVQRGNAARATQRKAKDAPTCTRKSGCTCPDCTMATNVEAAADQMLETIDKVRRNGGR